MFSETGLLFPACMTCMADSDEKPARPFVLYDLRHTFLTRLGESGCDVWTLARIAGHSNIKQSSRYVHPSNDAVVEAIERMGGHNAGPQPGGHKLGTVLRMLFVHREGSDC
jgi:hypothetical protein